MTCVSGGNMEGLWRPEEEGMVELKSRGLV
jgi:hypothetical protein